MGIEINFPRFSFTVILLGLFYRKLILSLGDKFRCVAPDHLGCGLSDKPSAHEFEYDLEAHSKNLLELVNSLGYQ